MNPVGGALAVAAGLAGAGALAGALLPLRIAAVGVLTAGVGVAGGASGVAALG
ncbi:hypothetical protein ACIQ9Q_05720 [Streptomyces sp. NPDC094438]|uniref:hypothetical protein n=1 Tax=Streptomyces sp. NPDC094438 TaxID=3366061 RepID=UPI0037FB9D1F